METLMTLYASNTDLYNAIGVVVGPSLIFGWFLVPAWLKNKKA